ncbi:MAG: hypothetical protein DCC43_15795 [Candidatus Brocadia sp.]|nr:hypothetical protein [Candidatus Brocadia sp. AMX3]MDG5995473.1 hypothetical protein [Candidatus Brocadia sp.]RIJ88786.1 MAG: hypothetical protein DCC43_15795 [Candidatus Brocadia sp.]
MNHYTTPEFWRYYQQLPKEVQVLADKNFQLLKTDSAHPSLQFKRIRKLWSVRVSRKYRAPGLDKGNTVVWSWIGSHAEYNKLISQ